MLDINTDSLKQMASIAASANTEIEQAVELLNRISTHDDWCCSERFQIIEGIQECKKTASGIMDSSNGFLLAIKTVMDEFLEKESGISRLFESVEGVIKKTLEIVATSGSTISGEPLSAVVTTDKFIIDPPMMKDPPVPLEWAKIGDVLEPLFKKPRPVEVIGNQGITDKLFETISTVHFEDLNL